MEISNIVTLVTGIAMFLFGMSLMGEGLKNVAGNRLETILWKVSGTPAKGILMGTLVTSVIQSSSATTVMIIGFLNAGIMQLSQAISVILGANIGTSITGWILCLSYVDSGNQGLVQILSTATLTAVIAVIGVILRMFSKKKSDKHLGNIMLGFSVLMFGMQTMSSAVAPLKSDPSFAQLFTEFSNPFFGIVIGIAVTAVLQSSSASVGILQALSITGAITFSSAVPIIMGIGIGAATPVLLSAIGASKNGKRAAFVYLFNDIFGALLCGTAFYVLDSFIDFSFMETTVGPVFVALINSIFRIVTMLILSPFIPLTEKFIRFIVKDKKDGSVIVTQLSRLEDRFIDHPALAIEQCDLVLDDMAEKARENLMDSMDLLSDFSEAKFDKITELEDTIDTYEDKLGTYLVKLTGREMTTGQTREVSKILHTISDFERIGDHAMNLSETGREIFEKHIVFSEAAQHDIDVIAAAVREIVMISTIAFESNDMDKALHVEPLEQLIDMLCDEIKLNHVNRIQTGDCSLNQGFVFDDMLTNFERVADHCSNIAVAMIELQSDSFDTHEYLNSLKTMRTESFDQYFNEYSRRFSI